MKRIGAIFFGLSVGILVVGCGGGGGADTAAVKDGLTKPTGTFEPTASADLGNSAVEEQEKSQGYGSMMGGFGMGGMGAGAMSASTSPQEMGKLGLRSLRALQVADDAGDDDDFDGGIQCPMDGSGSSSSGGGDDVSGSVDCKCADGGNVKIEISMKGISKMQTGPFTANYGMKFGGCKIGSTVVDGSVKIDIDAPSGYQKLYSSEGAGSLIFAASLKAVTGTEVKEIDAGYGLVEGRMWYLVKTEKGTFAVLAQPWNRETKTGTVYVKASNGSWTCQVTNGTADCKEGITAGVSVEGSASASTGG